MCLLSRCMHTVTINSINQAPLILTFSRAVYMLSRSVTFFDTPLVLMLHWNLVKKGRNKRKGSG